MRREKVNVEMEDPLTATLSTDDDAPRISADQYQINCVALNSQDELKIINAVIDASTKRTMGSVFNVQVDISIVGSLRLGVKDLHGGLLVVSVLKRPESIAGPGELSGIRIGHLQYFLCFISYIFICRRCYYWNKL